jgi:hypothetical protein
MKISTALILVTVSSAVAFAPTSVSRSSKVLFMSDDAVETEEAPAEPAPAPVVTSKCISKEEILKEPNTIEFQQVWDPLGLATLGGDETLAWFRHSEVKHGRAAMAAFVGWWAVAAGATLPGDLTYGVPFSSLPKEGLAAWDAVPGWGKAQMLMFAGLIEFHDEIFFSRRSTHYLKGGIPGKNMVPGLYDPLGFSANKSEEAKARGRSVEIKNGSLAMLAMAALYCEAKIPGSVPFQPDC